MEPVFRCREYKVVSTEVVKCQTYNHEAVIIVFENGYVEVRCEAPCEKCGYGKRSRMSKRVD